MTGRVALVAVAVAALGSGGGCGTVYNVCRPTLPPAASPGADVCRVYGGVRGDVGIMIDYPWRTTPSWLDYILLPALATVELGLTGFGDTLTLPYTVVSEARRALAGPGATQPPPPPRAPKLPAAAPAPPALPPAAEPEPESE